jgi:NAD(P)-dependent dehydrogenase (short-subunit alcohol dehydrogenase family)
VSDLLNDASKVLDLFRLDGRVAVVIGGSGGLGKAIALGFAGAGARVAVVSRRLERCQEVADQIEEIGGKAIAISADATAFVSLQQMVERVLERWGRIDILVNSAGTVHIEPTVNYPEEEYDRVMDINLKSIFLACKAVAPTMLKQRYGKIINISSVRGFQGRAGDPSYPASKAGVNLMTKSFALEWAKDGITVNAIAPTFVRTELNTAQLDDPEFRAWVLSRIPMGRTGEPEDLMGAAIFLASDASRFVTGDVLMVDGGWLTT